MSGPVDTRSADFPVPGGPEPGGPEPGRSSAPGGAAPHAPGPAGAAPLLAVDELRVEYRSRRGPRSRRRILAVDGVSFSVGGGEILALVGESGCGKTSIVRAIARLEDTTGGRILFRGNDVSHVRRG